jgi:DNA polymerase/3'-5' exonuclease PolX
MNLQQAQQIAFHFINLISPACERAMICGSVRRQKPEGIHDIEIVAQPRYEEIEGDLFGSIQLINGLEVLLKSYIFCERMSLYRDPQGRTCNGEKHKKILFDGAMIDLYTAEQSNWGNIVAIRTGNAEFSRYLVTPRSKGGLLPSHLKQADGYLWNGDQRIECPTEELFFAALELNFVEPQHRNDITAKSIARKRMSAGMAISGMVQP